MSEALTVYVKDNLPIPVGCTPKQVRLAELVLTFDPTKQTLSEIVEAAGYSPTTARAMARTTLNSIGVKRAQDVLQKRQMDSARGLAAIGTTALASANDDLRQLDPRERLAAGFKAMELAATLGEDVQQTGSGDEWKRRRRRAAYLGWLAGYRAATQHLVDSQKRNDSLTK